VKLRRDFLIRQLRILFLILFAFILFECGSPPGTRAGISIFQGKDYIAFCADSVRVYLSTWFDRSILQSGTDSCNGYAGVSYSDPELRRLLSAGELTGEMFCIAFQKETGSYPKPRYGPTASRKYFDSLKVDLAWHGGLIVVLQWLNRCAVNGINQTSLCVSMDPIEIGGHCLLFSFTVQDGRVQGFKYDGAII
jgi:hypothetical protein